METNTTKEKKSFPVLWTMILFVSIAIGCVVYYFFNLGAKYAILTSAIILIPFLWIRLKK